MANHDKNQHERIKKLKANGTYNSSKFDTPNGMDGKGSKKVVKRKSSGGGFMKFRGSMKSSKKKDLNKT